VQALRQHRLKSGSGESMVDVLMRHLPSSESVAQLKPASTLR